jgi:glycosyltransferase involved in cell wall biosynthesis
MHTLAIDSSSAQKQNRTGVEWYAYHLIEAIKRQPLRNDERVVLFSRDTLKWSLPFGWMKGRVSWEMLRRPPDVLLVPAQGLPLLGTCAAVVHDVGFRRVPGVYDPSDRRKQTSELNHVLRRAKIVFVVSDFTKRELTDLYGLDTGRVVVAPNAVNRDVYRPLDNAMITQVCQKLRVGNHYFLYVGRMDAKKNVKTVIRAFELFKASRGTGDPFELLLVGSPGFKFWEIKAFVDRSPAKASIRTFGYLPENEVASLMNGASTFLFPSWYEGFGVPPLEAAACGAPLIVSDIGAHREVLGNAALFVAPGEPEAWAKAMQRVTNDPDLVARLRAGGFERAAAYSWDKTAEVVLLTLRGMV